MTTAAIKTVLSTELLWAKAHLDQHGRSLGRIGTALEDSDTYVKAAVTMAATGMLPPDEDVDCPPFVTE